MSWLGRLFGGGGSRQPLPTPNTVAIPDDVAAALTAEGAPLGAAVEAALRERLAARAAEARAAQLSRDQRIPFWLARQRQDEQEDGGGLEERLRDRLEQRRAAEAAEDA